MFFLYSVIQSNAIKGRRVIRDDSKHGYLVISHDGSDYRRLTSDPLKKPRCMEESSICQRTRAERVVA